jgi:hypothetical protein
MKKNRVENSRDTVFLKFTFLFSVQKLVQFATLLTISVADPGFYPGSGFFPSWVPDTKKGREEIN